MSWENWQVWKISQKNEQAALIWTCGQKGGVRLGEENLSAWDVDGRCPRGRPKKTWDATITNDCSQLRLNREDAKNCVLWRSKIANVLPRDRDRGRKRQWWWWWWLMCSSQSTMAGKSFTIVYTDHRIVRKTICAMCVTLIIIIILFAVLCRDLAVGRSLFYFSTLL